MVAHGGSTVYNYCLFFLTSFVRCGALRIRIRPNNMGNMDGEKIQLF